MVGRAAGYGKQVGLANWLLHAGSCYNESLTFKAEMLAYAHGHRGAFTKHGVFFYACWPHNWQEVGTHDQSASPAISFFSNSDCTS